MKKTEGQLLIWAEVGAWAWAAMWVRVGAWGVGRYVWVWACVGAQSRGCVGVLVWVCFFLGGKGTLNFDVFPLFVFKMSRSFKFFKNEAFQNGHLDFKLSDFSFKF